MIGEDAPQNASCLDVLYPSNQNSEMGCFRESERGAGARRKPYCAKPESVSFEEEKISCLPQPSLHAQTSRYRDIAQTQMPIFYELFILISFGEPT